MLPECLQVCREFGWCIEDNLAWVNIGGASSNRRSRTLYEGGLLRCQCLIASSPQHR